MSSRGGHPSFQGFLKASGQAELWDRGAGRGKKSSDQLGWCRTHTTEYSSDTLIGNWNEERFDVTKLAQSKCLPSQYSHYFETTYSQGYSRSPHKVPEVLKYSRGTCTRMYVCGKYTGKLQLNPSVYMAIMHCVVGHVRLSLLAVHVHS